MYDNYAVYVENLVKIYGKGNVGIDGLSFTINPGEVYGLIGPNGSGKTTTLRILATLIKPTSGKAFIFGVDVTKDPLRIRKMINYLPEEAGAYRDLTGMDFIKFMLALRFRGEELNKAIDEAVQISDLGPKVFKPIRGYSKGMKRILALSVVLASKPKLLILDEPTTGLDVEKSLYVRNLIRKYNQEYGVTVLLSSHNMLEVEYLCQRVGMIYKGRIIAEGSIEDLKTKTNSRNLEEVFIKITREASY
ncbi:MAG: ABC transporter ATP-binding protein [Staphylothermus sp.]|nr:ABC transporter ATP-binding protein [Staphylothermus sp.]